MTVESNDNLECRSTKVNYQAIIFFSILSVASFIYFIFTFLSYLKGQQGYFRGASIIFMSSVFVISLFFRKNKWTIIVAILLLIVSVASTVDLICHNPGASVLGLIPRFSNDFDINFYGARELYINGCSPYGIEEKYQLSNTSQSFPFPTYAIYWACSAFGRWGKDTTGISFTFLNLIAVLLFVWVGIKIAGVKILPLYDNLWLSVTILFVTLNSLLWGIIMNGQTPLMAACFLVIAIWFTKKERIFYDILAGLLLVLGVLIKPNFGIFVLYFLITGIKDESYHHLRVFISFVLFIILFIIVTLVVPGGVNCQTYSDFITQVGPVLEQKIISEGNISLVGLISGIVGNFVSAMVIMVLLVVASIIVAIYKKLSWPVWLIITLLVSPITWGSYTVLALPVLFLIIRWCIKTNRIFDLGLLIIGSGMLYRGSFIGVAGLIIIFYLILKTNYKTSSIIKCSG